MYVEKYNNNNNKMQLRKGRVYYLQILNDLLVAENESVSHSIMKCSG